MAGQSFDLRGRGRGLVNGGGGGQQIIENVKVLFRKIEKIERFGHYKT